MRTVYALDYATAIARAIDAATGLKLGQTLVEERRNALECEAELEAAHAAFFKAVASSLTEDVAQELASKMNVSRTDSVSQTLIAAVCSHTDEAKPNKAHWQKRSMHQDLLRRMFVCYLDCLIGRETRFLDPLADFQARFQHALEHELEKEADKFFAKWGKLMLLPANLEFLMAALGQLPEPQRPGTTRDIFLAVVRADHWPTTDEFELIVRHFTEPKDKQGVN